MQTLTRLNPPPAICAERTSAPPVHAGIANIVFADGSIRSFRDTNKDGYLNPGFVVSPSATQVQLDKIGYRDSVVELDPQQACDGIHFEHRGRLKPASEPGRTDSLTG